MATLVDNKGVLPNMVFADRHNITFDWQDNAILSGRLDPTPMAIYPNIPAEMLRVLLSHHTPTEAPPPPHNDPDWAHLANEGAMNANLDTTPRYNDPDWAQLADEAAMNADLDTMAHLPPPPDVIEVEDGNDIIYVPPHTDLPLVEQDSPPSPTVEHDNANPPPTRSTGTSGRNGTHLIILMITICSQQWQLNIINHRNTPTSRLEVPTLT